MNATRPLLHSTVIGADAPSHGGAAGPRTLVMLHGLYGRGRNWQSIAQRLVAERPDWRALLVDLRLHGASPAFEPPHTLLRAAEDVRELIDARRSSEAYADSLDVGAVLGHSFGGKVALALARPKTSTRAAAALTGAGLRQIWIIDSTPEVKPPAGSAWDMLLHVRSLPATFAARADLVAALEHFGWPDGVAQWMATNLRYANGRYEWALNLDAMTALLESFFQTDLWDVVEHPPAGVHLHFVKAQGSNTLSEPTCTRIERAGVVNGQVHLHRLEGGHWLNADNPQGIVDLLARHLDGRQAAAAGGAR
jgi:pimeloyl-ACP methyl ester carboxylesterase